MIRGIIYTKPLAGAAVAAVVVAGAMFWMRAATHNRLADMRRNGSNKERELHARIASMSAFETENVNSLRRQVGLFHVHLGTDGTSERLAKRLDGWASDMDPKKERSGYSIQLGTFRLLSHAVGEWPEIVQTVGDLEAIPGVTVAELEMKTGGNSDRRSLDTATLRVELQTSRSPSNASITP